MDEPEDLLDILQRARPIPPTGLVSPHAPAAQALMEEILSMDTDTLHAPTTGDDPETATLIDRRRPTPLAGRPGRRGRRRLLVAGVAAAVAAVVTASVLSVDPGGQAEAATLDAAVAETTAALRGSGRAELRWNEEGDDFEISGTDRYEFSGDDVSVKFRPEDWTGPDFENREVDGERYIYGSIGGSPDLQWLHDVDGVEELGPLFGLDPETLLAALGDVTFEAAGDEDVDGVPTRHLRAASPEDVDPTPLSFGFSHSGATVATLDVWVDDDDLVRRIDLSTTRDSAEDGHFTASFSIRLFDFGAPITIEVPENSLDIDPAA